MVLEGLFDVEEEGLERRHERQEAGQGSREGGCHDLHGNVEPANVGASG